MLAALRFNSYAHQGVYVHSDEDLVLGVDPPTHYERGFTDAAEASVAFREGVEIGGSGGPAVTERLSAAGTRDR